MDATKKPVAEHIAELRTRLLLCLIPLIVGGIIAAIFHKQLLQLILAPLNQVVYFSSPMGGLQLIITLCLLSGVILTIPFLLYQIVRFVEPALPEFSKTKPLLVIFYSFVLLLLGIAFAYFISLPAALSFLIGFQSETIQSLISAREYFTFVTYYVLGFGVIFQLPLVMLVINTIHRLSVKKLLAAFKYVILLSFIVGAVLTPTPDPINQLIMAVPIVILYLLSLVIIVMLNRRKSPR